MEKKGIYPWPPARSNSRVNNKLVFFTCTYYLTYWARKTECTLFTRVLILVFYLHVRAKPDQVLLPFYRLLSSSPSNIRLGWKSLSGATTLAYWVRVSLTMRKMSFNTTLTAVWQNCYVRDTELLTVVNSTFTQALGTNFVYYSWPNFATTVKFYNFGP